ncbi:MAG TPA: ATP synthase F1 subunit delta [Anaeromyxobacteraceae bacterium]|nr:ATP synthase F1 subunit delta [Anaeromyxobacteraceae bacterium]
MTAGPIPRRYAKALFSLAAEQGKIDAWTQSLLSLREVIDSSAELRDVLENPIYSKAQRQAIAGKLVVALRLEDEPANFLRLLADRNRLGCLPEIVRAFVSLADQRQGHLRARVTSAVPLDTGVTESLADKFARATHARVSIESAVDPGLVGGVVAQVGSLTFDGSIRTQLEGLRATLKH